MIQRGNTIRLVVLGILGWLLFCFVFLAFIKLLLAGSLANFFFHWDAPMWQFLDCLIGAAMVVVFRKYFGLLSENSTSTSRDFFILIGTIPFVAAITTVLDIVGIEALYYGKTHTWYDWVMQYLIALITQTMVCSSILAYLYFTESIRTKERLSAARRAQSEMQLKLLQQKVDPHFLFNNLNVVSSLVEKDPAGAVEFLDRLAELYRYILQNQNVDVVPVRDELIFAQHYLYLLKCRFGQAYDFDWRVNASEVDGQMIVPAALQGLLENVVKHNSGDRSDPLKVTVKLDHDRLVVKNEMRVKSNIPPASGTGLEDLVTRYKFLTERPVEIFRSEDLFSVMLPLLELKK